MGALVDAGVPYDALTKAVESLGLDAHLVSRKLTRGGLGATKMDVHCDEVHSPHHDHPKTDHHESHSHHPFHGHTHEQKYAQEHQHSHRSLSTILSILDSAGLSDRVKAQSKRAFQILGEVEAKIHTVPLESVHFHEVGAVDTIVDIVCAAVGAENLGIDRWLASPLNVGSGTVKCEHGVLPVPAPATLALLADAPIYSEGAPMERVTPTGASILRMLGVRYEAMPLMRTFATGYGAGGRELPGEANLLRIIAGEVIEDSATPHSPEARDKIAVMDAVIDDSNPQLIAWVSDCLFKAGAWDVYRSSVQMKKGRTGISITVLSHPDQASSLREILFRETTTIGLRMRVEDKFALQRSFSKVVTPWGSVQIKTAHWDDGSVANSTPEYEDCRALAEHYDVPLKSVMQAAMLAWSNMQTAEEKN